MTSPSRDLTLHLRETRSGNALLEAARDLDRAASGADKFGDSLKGATNDAANLEHAIAKTKAQLRDLSTQFARTGDKSLFGDIRKQESHLRGLEKVLKEIRAVTTVAAGAELFGGGGKPGVLEFDLPRGVLGQNPRCSCVHVFVSDVSKAHDFSDNALVFSLFIQLTDLECCAWTKLR